MPCKSSQNPTAQNRNTIFGLIQEGTKKSKCTFEFLYGSTFGSKKRFYGRAAAEAKFGDYLSAFLRTHSGREESYEHFYLPPGTVLPPLVKELAPRYLSVTSVNSSVCYKSILLRPYDVTTHFHASLRGAKEIFCLWSLFSVFLSALLPLSSRRPEF